MNTLAAQALVASSLIAAVGSAYFWIKVYQTGNHLMAFKSNRWITIGFLIALLVLLSADERSEGLIYFAFFMGLSTATSFSLSQFAEENQFQRWNVIFAQLLLIAATLLSGLELIFSF